MAAKRGWAMAPACPKTAPRVAAYGEVDELNAVLGLVVANSPDCPEAALLQRIQNDLFDVGADLCVPQAEGEEPGKRRASCRLNMRGWNRPSIGSTRTSAATELHFTGWNTAAAWLHLARTVCRRAEARGITLMRAEKVNTHA